MGSVHDQPDRYNSEAEGKALICGDMVLYRDGNYGRFTPRGQFASDSGWPVQELSDFCGCAGRAGAMVVRAQRSSLLPDDALSRFDVLFPAESGRPAGVFLPIVDYSLLGTDIYLYLGGS